MIELIILQLFVVIAVIAFIVYSAIIYRRFRKLINNIENILKDHESYLNAEIKFRNSVVDALKKYTDLITLSNNTNLEFISKIRNSNKDRENKYNSLVSKLNAIANKLDINVTKVENKALNKAENSLDGAKIKTNSHKINKCDKKPKTAKSVKHTPTPAYRQE